MEVSDKMEKCVRLAESRTSNAVRAARVIGSLSDRSHHDFPEADVRKIVAAGSGEVDGLKRGFVEPTGRSNVSVRL